MATGIFLATLAATAVAFCAVNDREVWCRYACPLGNLSACYSVSSTVHVHANPMICTSQCKTHECYKGSSEERGCPMYLHPLYLKDAHFCKLCLSCVRNCPNGSAQLWLRPPLQDVWTLGELNPALVPLAWSVVALTPVMLAGRVGFAADVWGFTLMSLLALAVAAGLHRWLPRWLSSGAEPLPAARTAFAVMILAWGPLMAFHLGNVPGLETLVVHGRSEAFLSTLVPATGIPVLLGLQLAVVAGASLAGGFALWRIRQGMDHDSVRRRSWRALGASAMGYCALALALLLQGTS
jgi:polyferredoxin